MTTTLNKVIAILSTTTASEVLGHNPELLNQLRTWGTITAMPIVERLAVDSYSPVDERSATIITYMQQVRDYVASEDVEVQKYFEHFPMFLVTNSKFCLDQDNPHKLTTALINPRRVEITEPKLSTTQAESVVKPAEVIDYATYQARKRGEVEPTTAPTVKPEPKPTPTLNTTCKVVQPSSKPKAPKATKQPKATSKATSKASVKVGKAGYPDAASLRSQAAAKGVDVAKYNFKSSKDRALLATTLGWNKETKSFA